MPIVNVKNRGYYKIKGAADAFNFDFKNKVVLDIGSSTGGFTQYALDHGAKKVIAVEKGTNQMQSPLRHDHRVELHEKTDIFDFTQNAPAELQAAFWNGVRKTVEKLGLRDNFRTVANTGRGAGQSVMHFHIHIMSDERFTEDF